MFPTLIVQDVIRFILRRLHVNTEYSAKLFGLQLKHTYSHECYWLQPGYTIFELLDQYCTTKPMEEWRLVWNVGKAKLIAVATDDNRALQVFSTHSSTTKDSSAPFVPRSSCVSVLL